MLILKKTARVIVTWGCNRQCEGCCNNSLDKSEIKTVTIEELRQYEEIVITGGEPMLLKDKLYNFISDLKKNMPKAKIYLYTSYWDDSQLSKYTIGMLSGISFTIHNESTDKDIIALKNLSRYIDRFLSTRLFIDNRLYDKYDFSNINFDRWDVIRKLQWKKECEPAHHEELLYFPLDGR